MSNPCMLHPRLRALSLLLLIGLPAVRAGAQAAVPRRVIAADYARVKGPLDTFFNDTVGAGRAAEGLRADWQRDLAVAHRECGFRYLRFHGLLDDEMGVYSEDRNGKPVYNFQYVDAVYDALLKTGMRPFVELGFMPQALASGTQTIFWYRGNVTPPEDDAKWAALVQALVRHWTDRYGQAEVRQWRFEVWNEPNLSGFWTGTQARYFQLYAATAKAIKAVSPEYQVGGPATAGEGWVPQMIAYAQANQVPLDFITTHTYGVSGAGLDEFGVQQTRLDTSPDAIIRGVLRVRGRIKASALPTLPLHYTEWSASYTPRDPVHDSYVSAPYILSRLRGCAGSAASMSYWTFTDIFEEPGPVPTPFHGGFGLMNFQGLRKPAFYAYQFLNRLGGTELVTHDSSSWVCRSKQGGVQALFWDYTPPDTKESNQKYFPRDLPPGDAGTVRFSLAHLPPGTYDLALYQVGYGVNDVYTDYKALGSPRNLSREQVRALAARTDGRPRLTARVQITAGRPFTRDFRLRQNDACLITLEKEKKAMPAK